MSYCVGIIADDLSGATAMAAEFARVSLSAVVVELPRLQQARTPEADVVVVNTRTRYASEAEARTACLAATKRLAPGPFAVLIKKIDSMLRGPMGAELDGVFESMGAQKCLLVAAAPGLGRTTVDGVQCFEGRPIGDLMKSEDPEHASVGSHVPTLLASQTLRAVDVIPLKTVQAGEESIRQAVLGSTASILVADCTTERELAVTVSAAWSAGVRFFAGTYGLGAALAPLVAESLAQRAPVLVVAGSMSATTRRQVEYLLRRRNTVHIPLDAWHTLHHNLRVASIAAAQSALRSALADHQTAVLTTAYSETDQELLRQHASAEGWTDRRAAVEVDALVREVLKPVLGLTSAIVATGGSTAELVLDLVAPNELEVLGPEVVPGSPVTLARGGAVEGLRFITKPGSFGAEDALDRMASFLQQPAIVRITKES